MFPRCPEVVQDHMGMFLFLRKLVHHLWHLRRSLRANSAGQQLRQLACALFSPRILWVPVSCYRQSEPTGSSTHHSVMCSHSLVQTDLAPQRYSIINLSHAIACWALFTTTGPVLGSIISGFSVLVLGFVSGASCLTGRLVS